VKIISVNSINAYNYNQNKIEENKNTNQFKNKKINLNRSEKLAFAGFGKILSKFFKKVNSAKSAFLKQSKFNQFYTGENKDLYRDFIIRKEK